MIPGLGRSPGGGHGNTLQYSCLENSMDRGAWPATVYGVTVIHNSATEHNPEVGAGGVSAGSVGSGLGVKRCWGRY